MSQHTNGVPSGYPLVVAWARPREDGTCQPWSQRRRCRERAIICVGEGNPGGGDEGKRQERMSIKSQARVAYVCHASNSAAPSLSQRGNAHMAVTLPAWAYCSTPKSAHCAQCAEAGGRSMACRRYSTETKIYVMIQRPMDDGH